MLAQQGTNAAPLEVREALARAVEDAVGSASLQPPDLLQVLLACLDRALPTPPGQASVFQQLLGLQTLQVRAPISSREKYPNPLVADCSCPIHSL